MKKVLIANRGEIALRILRACRELGLKTVAVYSEVDRDLVHVKLADEAVCIGPADPGKSYLNIPAILSVAEITGVDAIHPGYGFLSENYQFVEQVENSGFIYIGPDKDTVKTMGNKVQARQIMEQVGVPCIPGSGVLEDNLDQNKKIAEQIGYPVIIKAAAGGGGRGMRVVLKPEQLAIAIKETSLEAKNSFGNGDVYLEKYLLNPRHIEVQILGDGQQNVLVIGDRDCSIQRRNQKVLEEAPAMGLTDQQRAFLKTISIKVCKYLNYRGAGTLEFLFENDEFYFIEMNTRVQVEHPITEAISAIDLVKWQLKIASGEKLLIKQQDLVLRGHAIECRINAEDPQTFFPSPGKISELHWPGGPGLRVDSHLYRGYEIPTHYDSLLGKMISVGETREEAILRMQNALREVVINGVKTTIPVHQRILENHQFRQQKIGIHFLENLLVKQD